MYEFIPIEKDIQKDKKSLTGIGQTLAAWKSGVQEDWSKALSTCCSEEVMRAKKIFAFFLWDGEYETK